MAVDLTRFHQGFFDEVEEHIANIEALLLDIDVAAPGNADFDGVFRAAHSIKGGAGTFGFSEMAKFTHGLESVLDRLRHGEFAITFAMDDIFLRACDVLKAQLAAYRDGRSAGDVSTRESRAELEGLQHAAASEAPAASVPAAAPSVVSYAIELRVAGTDEVRGQHYAALHAALAEMGPLSVPPEQSFEREVWQFTLASSATEESLRDLLGFIVDEPTDVVISAGAVVDASEPADDAAFGFFEDAPGVPEPESDAYGFFADAPGMPVAAAVPVPGRPAASGGAKDADSTIRVSLAKVDQLINLVGEMVIAQARLARISSEVIKLIRINRTVDELHMTPA